MRHITVQIIAFLFFTMAPATPAAAQTNPTAATCGLPAGGIIVASVTYTLDEDCTQSEGLLLGSSTSADDITVTINGGGNTINSADGTSVFQVSANVIFNLNNVTIVGGGRSGGAAIEVNNLRNSASFSNITLRDPVNSAIQFNHELAPAITHSLSSVLIEGGNGNYFHADHGIPLGLHAIGPVSLNINGIGLRGMFGGNAAIGANETYIVGAMRSLGTITFSGCFTVDGVFPRVHYGNIVDNSEGPCTGRIGNGGSSAMQYPQAPDSGCDMPLAGFIYGTYTFNLTRDCALTGSLIIPNESNVVINGNRHTIDASGITGTALIVSGQISLNNVIVSGAVGFPFRTHLNSVMTFKNTIFRDNTQPLIFQDSIVSFEKVLMENHQQSNSNSVSGVWLIGSAQLIIRDSVIRNNTGGFAVIYTGASYQYGPDAVVRLEGCITLEGNTPTDFSDTSMFVTDNRTGACPPGMEILVVAPPSVNLPSPGNNPHNPHNPPPGVCDGKPSAVPVGAIACIFRENGRLTVYRIDERSRGHFVLGVTQPQVDANGIGMVGAAADGFAAVYKLADGNVMVSVGPNGQGESLHITLDRSVNGRVLGMRTSYGAAPAAAGVKRPSALQGCMVRTKYMLNFRDGPAGDRITNFQDYHGMRHDWLPPFVTLTALERIAGWFKVDYHGTQGWINEEFVEKKGNCG